MPIQVKTKDRYGKTSSIRMIHRICDVLFVLFSFLYVYVMKSDVLALSQHLFSEGNTVYHPLVGAFILTLFSFVFQRVFNCFRSLKGKVYAISFIPSILFLIFITHLFLPDVGYMTSLEWVIIFILISIFGLLKCWFGLRAFLMNGVSNMYSLLAPNLFIFIILYTFMGLSGNTSDVHYYELQIQQFLLQDKYEKALEVGESSLKSTRKISCLRAYALAKKGEMGELLFEYPQYDGANGLLLTRSDSAVMLFSPDSIYRFIGLYPNKKQNIYQYLKSMVSKPYILQRCPQVRDYWLCALLLEKQLDEFVVELKRFYGNDKDSLDIMPKHYKEALFLYRHLRIHPIWVYKDEVMNANFNDFLDLQKQYKNRQEASNYERRSFGETYWWYYFYQPLTSH